MAEGYVKVYRSLLDWEWYTDVPTRSLFEHIRLRVNWKAGNWMGIIIPPGALVTSYPKLASETGLTEKQVRRALHNLETTGEVVLGRAGKGQLVTLVNWDKFQGDDDTWAGKGRHRGRQGAAIEEGKEGKKVVPKGTTDGSLFEGSGIDPKAKSKFRESAVGEWDVFSQQASMREAEGVGIDVAHYFGAIMRWSDNKAVKRDARGWVSTVEGSMARDKAAGKLVMVGQAQAKADERMDALRKYEEIT